MDIYSEYILDLCRNPLNKEPLDQFDFNIRAHNSNCGDDYEIYVKLDGSKIVAISYTGDGCAISNAALSILTNAMRDTHLADVNAMTSIDMTKLLGIEVSYTRQKCVMLGLSTLQTLCCK